jgi:endonuclease/exonuclease/phosphatase family metal-dependent hydrolase
MWRSGGVRSGLRRAGALAVGVVLVAAVACTPPPSDPGSPPTTLQPLPEPPSHFELLSYNVAGLPQEISKEQPALHLPMISPLLEDYDVVLTQEDFDWWQPVVSILDFVNYHRRLRAATTFPYRSDVHPGPAAVGVDPAARGLLVGDGIGFLSRYPLADVDAHAWTNCFGGILPDGGAADCLAMKGFRVATMVLGDGAEVDVYNLHAEAGGTARDQQLQVEDFAQLAQVVATRSAGRAVIVAGDTNLHTDLVHPDGAGGADVEIWSQFLAATGLVDSCPRDACVGRIDKVAYRSGGGVTLEPVRHEFLAERFTAPTGEALSDHEPLLVEFAWDRETAGPAGTR